MGIPKSFSGCAKKLFIDAGMELIKFVERLPPETIKYKEREFKSEDLLKEIALLFYEKGEAVESTIISEKLHLQKTEKFTEKVIRYHLEGRMVNCEYKKRRVFVSPLALIFVSRDGRVLDLTELEGFYDNLHKLSSKIIVNILKEQITLEELLLPYKGREREVIKKLFELCKIAIPFPRYKEDKIVYHDFTKYDLATIEGYFHRGFLLEDVSQKIWDSRYKLEELELNFIRWDGTGRKGEEFSFNDVTCEYEGKHIELPNEIKESTEGILRRKRKEAEEKWQVFDNHPGYKLLDFKISREIKKGERKHKLHLTFGPTDFYTCVCTNLSIDEPMLKSESGFTTIRRKYIREVDLSEPSYLRNSFLSNMFGVALATITEDDKIILQRRSKRVYMGPERITLATAENMIRGLDEDENAKPNPFITAKRCIKEELGEEIEMKDVLFLMFGVRLDNLLPQALGMVRLKSRSSDISPMKAKDGWEGKNFFEDFTISNLKRYFEESYLISDTAKLTILLALVHEFGFENIERQFKS
jgi:hypothetical protein